MIYKLTTLSNSLRIICIPMPSLESMTISVGVRSGSRVEESRVSGLAHFLEHMAFKGGRKYRSAKRVSEVIDAIGGEFNASTSKETTKYYIKARAAHLKKALDVLSDIVLHPNLPEREIEKEKGVIIEELKMYGDTPIRRIWDLFEQLIFEGHELGRDIIGTKDSIRSLKREDFSDYREKNYYAKNMFIAVAGKVTDSKVEKLVSQYFGELKEEEKVKSNVLPAIQTKPRFKLHFKDIEQAHFILGFPADPLGGEDRYKDSVMNAVLSGGMSSRLFTEVREKRGLAYSVRSDLDRFTDTGYYAIYSGTDPEKCERTIKVILDQVYGLATGKLKTGKKELQKAKEYLKGHLALSLEDTADVADFFGYEQLMLGKTRTPEEVFAKVDEVTSEDVVTSAKKIFDPKKINLCIMGPYKGGEKFEKIIRIIYE